MNRTLLRICAWAVALPLAACGSTTEEEDETLPPQRTGTTLDSTELAFLDHEPSVSADGTKIAFVSGRATKDDKAVSKAFKLTWPRDGTPGEPKRLTKGHDLGRERNVAVSPDGAWAVVTAVKDGRTDVHLRDFAGEKKPVRLTDNDAVESRATFSPDSKFVAWLSGSAETADAKIRVVAIGDGTAETVGKPKAVTKKGEAPLGYIWLEAGGSYKLAFLVPGSRDLSEIIYKTVSFSTPGDASAAQRNEWFRMTAGPEAPRPVGSAARGALAAWPAQADERVTELGNFPYEEKKDAEPVKSPLISEPVVVATGSSEKNHFDIPPGFELLDHGLSADGNLGIWLSRNLYRCQGKKRKYGVSFASGFPGQTKKRWIPRFLGDGEGWDAVTKFCSETEDENQDDGDSDENKKDQKSKGTLDRHLTAFVLNPDASQDDFRLVYVSRFSKHCDANSADPEVMGLQVRDGSAEVRPISKNRKSKSECE